MQFRGGFLALALLAMIASSFAMAPVAIAQYTPDLDEIEEVIEEISAEDPTFAEQYDDIQRQGLIFAGICAGPTTECPCRDLGQCQLEDILQVVVNLTVFILGIIGSIILIVFLYGGFLWLTAGGSMDRVKKGINVMRDAIIGLIIVFGSYALITVLINVLQEGEIPESGETLEDVIGDGASDVIETSEE